MGLRRVISTPHQRVHEGVFFSCGHLYSAVADAASVLFLIKVGATLTQHTIFSVSGAGDLDFALYEGPTITADGTAVTAFDHNRVTANSASGTYFHTPTISANGTQLNSTIYVPGGQKSGGGSPVGANGSNAFDGEIILATSTNYLIEVTNNAGVASDIYIGVSFYES